MPPDTHTTTDDQILLRQDDGAGVCTLTLNRPARRNALSAEMLNELQAALDDIAPNKSIKVVIIEANGPVFSAGHDLKEVHGLEDEAAGSELFLQCSRMMTTLTQLPQPVIAKVHGVATAAGCQLVASCDLAVASDDSRFATPGVNIGVFCTTPAVAIGRAVGRKHAMEMLLTGEMFSAGDAYRFGLVNKIVPVDQLDSAVDEYAQKIIKHSTRTVSLGKQAFYRQMDMDLSAAYDFSSGVMAENVMDDDAKEGMGAFLEKRDPKWKGR